MQIFYARGLIFIDRERLSCYTVHKFIGLGGALLTTSTFAAVFVLFMIIFLERKRTTQLAVLLAQKRKKKGRKPEMFELAKRFIGKECIVYTANNAQISGVIQEVSGNALRIESGKTNEIVNLEFVVRIREYPTGKNGKKKSVIFD